MKYQKWHWLMIAVNACLYCGIVLTIFFLVPNFESGHVVPWTLAILSGLLLFGQAIWIAFYLQKQDSKAKILSLLIGGIAAFLMAVLSILDMVSTGNHAVSKVLFLVVPLISLIVNAVFIE